MGTAEIINENKIIAIVRGQSEDNILRIAEALLNGGVRCMEITYNASDKASDEMTAKTVKKLNDTFSGNMLFGAGTVLSEKQVSLTKEAGGQFIVSPNVNTDVIKKTKELKMVSIPGAFTPSECESAHCAGADFVKLFPAINLGAEYLKMLTAPLSHIKFMAVGGITVENAAEFMKAGACSIAVGGDLIDKEAVKNGEFYKITERAKKYMEIINNAF